ncbi:MAG TPA: carboxypeptidase-like regulatory domain-containing protein [Gemmatimonadaceae bacterium]|nr:carboxypeptidase-like regulatory domain-containing protein [Gemmatimonadaceae bacterium]
MRILSMGFALLPLATALSQTPVSQSDVAQLHGVATDSATNRPLTGVHITIQGTSLTAVTDSTGRFVIGDIPPGSYVVRFRALGYDLQNIALEFDPGRAVTWDQALAATAVHLEPVVVNKPARELNLGRGGFDQRRKVGRGQFMTQDEWNQFAPRDVASVLRRFHSLNVKFTGGESYVLSTRGDMVSQTEKRGLQSVACAMRIGLDGQLMPPGFTIDQIPLSQTQAIEVYAGPAEMPAEFNNDLGAAPVTIANRLPPELAAAMGSSAPKEDIRCGLVMIWSR